MTGGMPLPRHAQVVPLRCPVGDDIGRKVSLPANSIHYLTSITRHVRSADVVHTPLPGDISFLGMTLATALRKRLFGMYNGSWITNPQTTVMDKVTRAWMKILAGGNNVMVAVGPAGMATTPARHMEWLFVTTIAQGELTTVQPVLGRLPHSPLQVGYVGRLSPEKGLTHLIEAMSTLRADATLTSPMPQLTLMGDGSQRSELLAQVRRLRCEDLDRKSTRLNSSHSQISYAVFCLKKKKHHTPGYAGVLLLGLLLLVSHDPAVRENALGLAAWARRKHGSIASCRRGAKRRHDERLC